MSEPLRRGDSVPDFDVPAWNGAHVRYRDVWQRKGLIFVCLPERSAEARAYADGLCAAMSEHVDDVVCLITSATISGVGCPAVVVADRWGEVQFARHSATVGELPEPSDVVDWIDYVEMRCPECEGEWR